MAKSSYLVRNLGKREKMQKSCLPPSIVIVIAISWIFAFSLSAYGKSGGPLWTYWLGDLINSALLCIVGLILMIGSATSTEFVRKIHSLKDPNDEALGALRLIWIIIGFSLILFGGGLFWSMISKDPNCPFVSC